MAAKQLHTQLDFVIASIRNTNLQTLETVLQGNPEVVNSKYKTERGTSTPLIEACEKGDLDIVKEVLKYGADITATGNVIHYKAMRCEGGYGALDEIFALFIAARQCYSHIVGELLRRKAPVDQTNAIGQSALHGACMGPETNHCFSGGSIIEVKKVDLIEHLIKYGGDINTQDHHGKTPLHYACEHSNRNIVKLLLEKGAKYTLRDQYGFSPLDSAAHSPYDVLTVMLEECQFTIQEIIEAHETAMVSLTDRSPYFHMAIATSLRIQHNIPKNVLPPMECYGYAKEWESLDELESWRFDDKQLQLQGILVWERIYKNRYKLLISSPPNDILNELYTGMDLRVNILLKHHMDLFQKNGDYLYFSSVFDLYQNPVYRLFDQLQTEVIQEFIAIAIQSCRKIKEALMSEMKPSHKWELIKEFEFVLRTAAALIAKLMRRNQQLDNNETEKTLAKEILKQLVNEFPEISNVDCTYKVPFPHVLFGNSFLNYRHRPQRCLPNDYELIKTLLDIGYDVDDIDNHGNTILHMAIKAFLHNIIFHDEIHATQFMADTEQFVSLFLQRGVYLHARNNQRETAMNLLQNPKYQKNKYVESVVHAMEKYALFPTLKRLAADKVRNSCLHYKTVLPKQLVTFTDMH